MSVFSCAPLVQAFSSHSSSRTCQHLSIRVQNQTRLRTGWELGRRYISKVHSPSRGRESGLNVQKRQARVTVKYNRKELQRRLGVEKWIDSGLDELHLGRTLYSCMPVVINMSSATAVNLSLLAADLFSLFCGLFLFQYTFSGLYIVSLMVIILGFIMFNIVLARNQIPEPASEEEGHNNQAAETNDERQAGCEVENQEKSQTDSSGNSLPAENGHG